MVTKTRKTFRIDNDLIKEYTEYCDNIGINIITFIEDAIREKLKCTQK